MSSEIVRLAESKDKPMRLQIRARSVELSPALREHIERRLSFALGRFGTRIGQVRVRLADLNGLRRGMDQRCHIEVSLVLSGKVRAEVTDADIETAVNRAADRIGRRVKTELDRRRVNARDG